MKFTEIGEFRNDTPQVVKYLEFELTYTDIANFNNSLDVNKGIVLGEYSISGLFYNNISTNRYDYVPNQIFSDYTTIGNFNNGYLKLLQPEFGLWSLGVFDIASYASMLVYDDYGYEETVNDLLYPTLTYNWFNNNIPSKKVYGQARVIPWGYDNNFAQFSIRFPFYPLETQFNIEEMNTASELDMQLYATPPIEMDSLLEVQGAVELDKFPLDFQLNIGESLTRLLNIQGDVDSDIISVLNIQNILNSSEIYNLNTQFASVFDDSYVLDIQTNISGLTTNAILDLQYSRVYNDLYNIDLQGEVLPDVINVLNMQVISSAPLRDALELQNTIVYNDSYLLDVQGSVAYPLASNIDIQYNVSDLVVFGVLDTQFFATPPITEDRELELQYQTVFHDIYSLDTQFHVDRFIANDNIEIQVLSSATLDAPLDVQASTLIEYSVNSQFKNIALGYSETFGQLFVLPTAKYGLDIQTSLVIIKNYPLDLQNSLKINTNYNLDLQTNIPSMNKNYPLDIESKVKDITTNIDFNLQWVNALDETYSIDMQSFTSVEMDAVLDIMVDTIVSKNYPLDIQTFTSVNRAYGLDIQSSLAYIEANTDLQLEFDVLDLVYYMMYEGYNIIPWWSDGIGSWNNTIDKNWDKEDLRATNLDIGLLNQLNDLGIDIDNIEMLDTKTRNFVYFNQLINNSDIEVKDKILKLNYLGTKQYLTLGKSKKGDTDMQLKKGTNIVFYDGAEEKFNPAIRNHIEDKIINTLVWKPNEGEWELFWDDMDVYFYEDIDGKPLPMPYIFVIEVTEDCSVMIER